MKTKSLERLEGRMTNLAPDSLRYKVLESAKNFKTSWIELGGALYSVWKDRAYKEWGYLSFDAYTQKEIGIKKPTAMKLLKSYYFLEKEEPVYLEKERSLPEDAASLPSYESVNMLRLAKDGKRLDSNDYQRFKKDVLERGKEPGQLRKDLTTLMRQREELDPDEARQRRKIAVIKRIVASLKTLKTEMEAQKLLPAPLVKEISLLINKLETEIP